MDAKVPHAFEEVGSLCGERRMLHSRGGWRAELSSLGAGATVNSLRPPNWCATASVNMPICVAAPLGEGNRSNDAYAKRAVGNESMTKNSLHVCAESVYHMANQKSGRSTHRL